MKTPPGSEGAWPLPARVTPARVTPVRLQPGFPTLLETRPEDSAGTRGPLVTEAGGRPQASAPDVRRVAIAVFAALPAVAPAPQPKRLSRRRQRQKARGDEEP
ncbi:MAG: hypothetical protein O2905_04385 [Proteobacteria bacterium]|nr:hypothetical protein [Pseudomonadota bacterium]MDA1132446.1 hypothetical protein [Pseudomonadota bacterium]